MPQLRPPRSRLLHQLPVISSPKEGRASDHDTDPDASPISSSDEDDDHELILVADSYATRNIPAQAPSLAVRETQNLLSDVAADHIAPSTKPSGRATRKEPCAKKQGVRTSSRLTIPSSPPSSGTKRKRDASEEVPEWMNASTQERAQIYSSQPSKTYSQRHGNILNIHSSPKQDHSKRRASQRAPAEASRSKRPGFKRLDDSILNERAGSNKANFKDPGGTQSTSSASQKSSSSAKSNVQAFKDIPHSSMSSNSSCSSLSPPPDDELLQFTAETLDLTSSDSHCPLCGEEVPRAFLMTMHSGLSRLSWKERVEICAAHKRHAADSEWKQHQYPAVDWGGFDQRLKSFHGSLNAILELKRPSYYRKELEQRVDEGSSRNAYRNPTADDQETTIPGYYGLKGAQRMQSHLVNVFSDKIRALAATDKLIPATGPAGYIQAVLVPELAVMLVREDLDVDEEKARTVLRESSNVGRLLNSEMTERVERRRLEEH
ncbi:MAG: hypothetical protein M1828_005314 [Chrysothrix sp. TS-e1954]|nr:MAG: hypothetical protein M1828_005314 [Chrysothrix sp. TS-e1954]